MTPKMLRTTRRLSIGGTVFAAGTDVPPRSFPSDVLARLLRTGGLVPVPRRRRVRAPLPAQREATPGSALHRRHDLELVRRPTPRPEEAP